MATGVASTNNASMAAKQTHHHMQRKDSVHEIEQHRTSTSQALRIMSLERLERQRRIRLIMEQGQRQAKQRLIAKDDQPMKKTTVPVMVEVDHCAFIKNPEPDGGRTGNALRDHVFRRSAIQTLHAPLQGINATSYAEMCTSIRQVYDNEFGRLYQRHPKCGTECGGLIMELYLTLEHYAPDTTTEVTEANWQQVLGMLTVNHLSAIQNGGPDVCAATSSACFTCPLVGKVY